MADTFYATLELKNIRMEGFLFSFLDSEFGRNRPTNFRLSGTLKKLENIKRIMCTQTLGSIVGCLTLSVLPTLGKGAHLRL